MADRIATIYDLARFKKALCDKGSSCYFCPLGLERNGENVTCNQLIREYTDKASEIILKWCKENPQKTYKDDFLEKFPNAKMNKEIPSVCRDYVYGIKKECGNKKCEVCWNEVINE